MATYNRLLVGAGGGIINKSQQSEREPDATICIGLGGTGGDALKKLKREVYKRLKPDDTDSPVPTYKNIKFLLIDSDTSKLGIQNDIGEIQRQTEFFDISNGDIEAAFTAKDILNRRKEMKWLNHEHIVIKDAMNGAGGIRQVGRFLLIDKATALRSKLTAVINEAIQGVTGELNIHIFTGLSGGTGSGTFIDVCYIVRNVLESLGRTGNSRICGYFFLPDVNLSVPTVAADPLISSFIRINGYAALKELGYLMNLEEGKGRFKQDYSTFTVDTVKPPVDLCNLISTTTTSGVLVENGYQYGLSVAVDFVIAFLSKVTLPDGVVAGQNDQGQTLKGHISNLEAAKNGIPKIHGASIDYNVIGASNAEMPLSEIATYLGSKLFEQFDFMYDKTPSENYLTEFVAKNQLNYEQILSRLTKGINFQVQFPKYDPSNLMASNRQPIDRADAWIAAARGSLQENRKSMEEKLKDYRIPENTTSLISKIYHSLYTAYATDSKFGPFFAMRLLCGRNNKNLLHVIDGYITKNDSLMAAEVRQDQLRQDDVDNTYASLKNANILNRKKRSEDYLGALNNHYVHLANIEKYSYMQGLLKNLRDEVVELNNGFFDVLTTVLDTLKHTFEENSSILTTGIRTDNTYTWKILDIPDIQGQLDDEVTKLDVNQVMRNFITRMFDEYPKWLSQDVNKIALLISDFIINQFKDITQKTIQDYLKIKFSTADPVVLKQKIKGTIIQNVLSNKAEPMFWTNSLFNMNQIAKLSTLSVPFDAVQIVEAAEEFGAANSISVRKIGLTDRIFMMRFYTGVPLYAYQGLQELEKAYEADNSAGHHLYEAGEVDWREFLPSPIPDSFRIPNHKIDRIINRNDRLSADLEKAREKGIIFRDTVGWHVKITRIPDVKELLDAAGGYHMGNKIDQEKLVNVIDRLKEYRSKMYEPDQVELVSISTKGAKEGAMEDVLRDNYLRFPEIEKMVVGELRRTEELEQRIAKLEQELANGSKDDKLKESFFNAVFTGVIQMGLSKMIYKYEEFGMEETLDLQNNKMPYAKCAVYQAYMTFRELNEEMRSQITGEAADRLDNLTEEMLETARKIKARYTSDFLKLTLTSVATDRNREEIKGFYQDFMQALQTFIQTYQY